MDTPLSNIMDGMKSQATSWEEKLALADLVALEFGKEATRDLCSMLESDDGQVRNAAALALKDIKDSSAVEPLMRAINNPQNHDDRSTLVYALTSLDCSRLFSEILRLVLAPKADVSMAAWDILSEQGFFVDDALVNKAVVNVEKSAIEADFKEAIQRRLLDFRTEVE